MITAQAVLVCGIRRLREVGIDDAAQDARRLLSHALRIDRTRLTLVLPKSISDVERERFESAIMRRMQRQPVSHIIGKREFFGLEFQITPDVLDPRPETEVVVQCALSIGGQRILDLGTGGGAILISYLSEMQGSTGVGVDMSVAALDIARNNANINNVSDRVEFIQSNWFEDVSGRFDVIVSNPPYISELEMQDLAPEVVNWEPHLALTPGGDGLDAYRVIVARAIEFLSLHGALIVEIGATQGHEVAKLFTDSKFDQVTVLQDLDGRDRVVFGRI